MFSWTLRVKYRLSGVYIAVRGRVVSCKTIKRAQEKKQLLKPTRSQPQRAVKQKAMVNNEESPAQQVIFLQNMIAEMQQEMEAIRRQLMAAEEARREAETARLTMEEEHRGQQAELRREREDARLAEEARRELEAAQLAVEGERRAEAEERRAALAREEERNREQLEQARQASEEARLAVVQQSGHSPATSTGSASDTAYSRATFSIALETLPKFSATDPVQTVQKWIARVDEDAIVNGWSEYEKLIAAKRALIGAARRWFESEKGIVSWPILADRLEEEFGVQLDKHDIHESLRHRTRKKDENIVEYVQEMEYIGSQGDMNRAEVRKYIAQGFTSDKHARAALCTVQTRAQFMSLLKVYEREGLSRSAGSGERGERDPRTCFACGKVGHVRSECGNIGQQAAKEKSSEEGQQWRSQDRSSAPTQPTCYKCGTLGHIALFCPKKQPARPSINRVVCEQSVSDNDD